MKQRFAYVLDGDLDILAMVDSDIEVITNTSTLEGIQYNSGFATITMYSQLYANEEKSSLHTPDRTRQLFQGSVL